MLVAEIVALGGRREIEDRFGFFYWGPPSFDHELDSSKAIPPQFEDELRGIRDRFERERRDGGWEVDRILEEVREGRHDT